MIECIHLKQRVANEFVLFIQIYKNNENTISDLDIFNELRGLGAN